MSERTFTFSNGVVVKLRKISQFMLSRLMVDNTSKFEVPQKLVKIGMKQEEKLIPDYDNPNFLALVETQINKDRAETLGNLSVFAVIDEVPTHLLGYYTGLAYATQGEKANDGFIKSLWLLDMIETEQELSDFQEAILGINHVTQRGVEASQEKFQSSD